MIGNRVVIEDSDSNVTGKIISMPYTASVPKYLGNGNYRYDPMTCVVVDCENYTLYDVPLETLQNYHSHN